MDEVPEYAPGYTTMRKLISRELKRALEFAELADMQGALMFWETDPLPETVSRLEAMGIESVVFKPGATQPEQDDYLLLMRDNLQRLETAVL